MRPTPEEREQHGQHLDIRWLTAFVDVPAPAHTAAARFWCAVTGFRLSEARGDTGQFATFLPGHGDAYLRLQRVGSDRPGIHLDVHVDGIHEAAASAVFLGARVVTMDDDVIVVRSPGGLLFCLVPHHGEHVRPAPARTPGGLRSQVDQVCLDITPQRYAAELAFWEGLTGWVSRSTDSPEFHRIDPPPGVPVLLLLQRLDTPADGPTRAHLDLACDSVPDETARHTSLGARVVAVHDGWTTLVDPAGAPYCLTARTPRD